MTLANITIGDLNQIGQGQISIPYCRDWCYYQHFQFSNDWVLLVIVAVICLMVARYTTSEEWKDGLMMFSVMLLIGSLVTIII